MVGLDAASDLDRLVPAPELVDVARQVAAEEGETDAGEALVGAQLQRDELARVGGRRKPDHQRVVGGRSEDTRGDVGDLHLPASRAYATPHVAREVGWQTTCSPRRRTASRSSP